MQPRQALLETPQVHDVFAFEFIVATYFTIPMFSYTTQTGPQATVRQCAVSLGLQLLHVMEMDARDNTVTHAHLGAMAEVTEGLLFSQQHSALEEATFKSLEILPFSL